MKRICRRAYPFYHGPDDRGTDAGSRSEEE